MIGNTISNKNLYPLVIELFIRPKKVSIYLVFNTQFCFAVPKYISLNAKHYFKMKIPHKRKLQQTTINHSLDLESEDFMKTILTN